MTIILIVYIVVGLALVLTLAWCVRRISLLRMTRWDLQECMNTPIFIIRPNGDVLSFRNALRNADKKLVVKMYEDDKNVYDWLDESSRRLLRQRVEEIMHTRERQEFHLTFLNALSRSEVTLIWYGPRSLAFVINMPSVSKAEMQQLRSEASLLGSILDNLPIATTVKDVHERRRYMIVNKQVSMLYLTSRDAMLNHGMSALPADMQEVLEATDQEVLRAGVCDREHAIRFPDGSEHTLSIHKVLVANTEGNPAWIVTSAWDISDLVEKRHAIDASQRKLSEARLRAEESDRLKEEFLRNISIEMRTPLTAIVGFSRLLVDTEDPQQRNDLALIISNNCDALVAQFDDMIQISKIQSGNISLHLREIDLNPLIDECVGEGNWADKPQLTYDKVFPPRQYRAVLDRRQVRVILRQLISNAIKFTDKGGVEVGYEVLEGAVQFYVRDTGVGIAPEHTECIFRRFEKAGSMRPGVGLGLTICRSLVELMQGDIRLDSQLGVGTTVTVTIPTKVEEIPADESPTVSRLWDQLMTVRTMRDDLWEEK